MWRSTTCRRRRSGLRPAGAAGFSLIEIMVVVAVIMVIAVIVGPLTLRMLVRLRIESFADQVSTLIQRTRAQAVRENKIYTLTWAGESIVPSGPYQEIDDWTQTWEDDPTGVGISDAAVVLAADAHGLTRYTAAPCLDHDGDGTDESVAPPLLFDGLGAPLTVTPGGRLQSGLVAFCFADPPRSSSGRSNVMQVRIDSTSGTVKVSKLIDDGDTSSGVRFADEAEKFEWEWY